MPDNENVNSANTSAVDGKNTDAAATGETHASKSQSEGTGTDSESGTRTYTQAELEKYVGNIRKEEKRKFEQQVKDAALSETERLTKLLAEKDAEIKTRDARDAIVNALRKAGSTNVEGAYLVAKETIEFDQNGKVANLADAMSFVRDKCPEFFPKRPGSANGGDGSAGSFKPNMNTWIRRSAGTE